MKQNVTFTFAVQQVLYLDVFADIWSVTSNTINMDEYIKIEK